MIFSVIDRTDLSRKLWSEPSFRFLDRSARPTAARVREKIEEWASHYPQSGVLEWRGNFRSSDDAQHHGAMFELLLHELLRRLGCTIELHPTLEETSRRPDFLVHGDKGHEFLLEATVCMDHPDSAAESRLSDLRDSLDRIRTTHIMFDLRYDGMPEEPVPGGRIRREIETDLSGHDVEVLRDLAENGEWDRLPSWEFTFPGITLHLTAFPTRIPRESPTTSRAVGITMGGAQIAHTDENIRDAVLRKASRYGKPSLPYVVAVNVLGDFPPESIDIFNALFGKEALEVGITIDGIQHERDVRQPDGVWYGRGGLQNRRVSGVLIGSGVGPWNLGESGLQLVTNPHAYHTYECELTSLDRWVTEDDGAHYTRVRGLSLPEVFEIPQGWPSSAAP